MADRMKFKESLDIPYLEEHLKNKIALSVLGKVLESMN
jgi:hypothetical protein